jgi:hypothetical protein
VDLDHRLEQGVVLLQPLEAVGGGLDPAGLLGSRRHFFFSIAAITLIAGLQNIGVPISCAWDPHSLYVLGGTESCLWGANSAIRARIQPFRRIRIQANIFNIII